ncbi:MAG: type transport system ATP-binding protein [Frankiales bacterium]|nr:type transport system ATP-binding protein [Frankiales bacterium]
MHSLDLEIQPGAVVGFLGPNGAGKTTVIRILTTVLPADSGSFVVAGARHDKPIEIRRRVGVLPESAGYPEGQTGEELLSFHAQLYGTSRVDAKASARQLLRQVGLTERGKSLVAGYSRGMRQRLGIARALVHHPQVIFLDEPSLGLDPAGQRQVLDLIASIARDHGATIVLSTHLLAEVEEICSRVLILNRGRVVADGTVQEVARRAAAPRQATVRVPAEQLDTAVRTLAGASDVVSEARADTRDELHVQLRDGVSPEAGAARILGVLLNAQVAVLAFEFERGRLSDAFITLTADA